MLKIKTDAVKLAMMDKGLGFNALRERAGMSSRTLTNIIGKNPAAKSYQVDTVARLAKALDVKPSDIAEPA